MPDPITIIRMYAPRFGLDPSAVVAYALTQGGVHWGARGDQGTSFGPFQLHRGGALGSHNEQWANSQQGLIAAMQMMSHAGAKGMTGPNAAAYIVGPAFGRGADPARDQAKARAAYSRAAALLGEQGGSSSLPSGGPLPPGAPPQAPEAAAPAASVGPPPNQLIGGALQKMFASPGNSIMPFLDRLQQIRSMQQAGTQPSPPVTPAPPGAVSPSPPVAGGTAPSVPSGRDKNGLTFKIEGLAQHFGLKITSGFRSIAKQKELYAHRSSSGSVAAPGKSYHNVGRAIDVAPNKAGLAFLSYAFAHPGQFVEVFYDPAGRSIKNGKIVNYTIGGHTDHIHIAQ